MINLIHVWLRFLSLTLWQVGTLMFWVYMLLCKCWILQFEKNQTKHKTPWNQIKSRKNCPTKFKVHKKFIYHVSWHEYHSFIYISAVPRTDCTSCRQTALFSDWEDKRKPVLWEYRERRQRKRRRKMRLWQVMHVRRESTWDIFHREHIHMRETFALKLILLINQGYLDVIHRHRHADTYTDN